MSLTLLSTYTFFAAGKPTGLWALLFLPVCLVGWLLFRGLLRSEKAKGFVQPILWLFAGTSVVVVVIGGIFFAIHEYSKFGLRFSQDGLLLLGLLGILAVAGGLLWIGRTTEGSRILDLLWRFYRFIPIALGLTLLVIYILFGFPRHH